MATDGPDPPPCDPDLFRNGTGVFMSHTIPSNAFEEWVKLVAAKAGCPVDWSVAGGRDIVRCYPKDKAKVVMAIASLKAEHDALYRVASAKYGFNLEPPWCFL